MRALVNVKVKDANAPLPDTLSGCFDAAIEEVRKFKSSSVAVAVEFDSHSWVLIYPNHCRVCLAGALILARKVGVETMYECPSEFVLNVSPSDFYFEDRQKLIAIDIARHGTISSAVEAFYTDERGKVHWPEHVNPKDVYRWERVLAQAPPARTDDITLRMISEILRSLKV